MPVHPEDLTTALKRVVVGNSTPEAATLLADLADLLEASCEALTAARLKTSAELAPAYRAILQARRMAMAGGQ